MIIKIKQFWCRYLLLFVIVMWKVASSGDEVYEKEILFILFFVKFIVVYCRVLSVWQFFFIFIIKSCAENILQLILSFYYKIHHPLYPKKNLMWLWNFLNAKNDKIFFNYQNFKIFLNAKSNYCIFFFFFLFYV